MGQDVVTYLAICFFAPHAQVAVETTPHLCVSETNTGSEAITRDPRRSGKANSRWRWAKIFNKYIESRGIFLLLHAPFIFRPSCYTVS